jgi:hypothetical protein
MFAVIKLGDGAFSNQYLEKYVVQLMYRQNAKPTVKPSIRPE